MVDGVVLHKIGWCITCDANDCQHIQDANQSLINSMSRPMIDAVEWSPKHHGHMPLYWKPDMEASLDGKSFVHQDWAWIAGSTYHVPYEAVHGGPRPEVVEGDAGAGLDLITQADRDAAKKASSSLDGCECDACLSRAAEAFARHRQQATEALQADNALKIPREPTQAMLKAGDLAWSEGTLILAIWQAMYDAALQETGQ